MGLAEEDLHVDSDLEHPEGPQWRFIKVYIDPWSNSFDVLHPLVTESRDEAALSARLGKGSSRRWQDCWPHPIFSLGRHWDPSR